MAAPLANPRKPCKPVIKRTMIQIILKPELLHVTFSHVSVAPTGHPEHISPTAQVQEIKTMERYGFHFLRFSTPLPSGETWSASRLCISLAWSKTPVIVRTSASL